jgi:molecular chaperone GrpE
MSDENTNPPAENAVTPEPNESVPENPAPATCVSCAELEAKWKRAAADLVNYRKQAEEDRLTFAKFAGEKILNKILPVLDNFKRATQHTPAEVATSDWGKGVNAIETQLEQTLADLGLQKIAAELDSPADPTRHQIIGTGPGAQGTIIEVLEDGYELHGKLVRTAKVKVGDGN